MNSTDAYCGPLSLLTSSGIPCLAKIAFRALITSCDLVVFSMAAKSIVHYYKIVQVIELK